MDIKNEQRLYDSPSMLELSAYVKDLFNSFKASRRPFEEIWEECWYNYLGQYQPSNVWKQKTEGRKHRSKIFIKSTTLKCNTAHAKIMDIYSGKGGVPFSAKPVDFEHAGIGIDEAKEIVEKKIDKIKRHFTKIDLEEKIDTAVLECAILGSTVIKGPIIETKRVPKLRKKKVAGIEIDKIDSEVNPYEIYHEYESYPTYDHIPLWEYYVDVNAKINTDSVGEIHFQRLLPAVFRRFAFQGGYYPDAVFEAARRATTSDADDTRYIQLADNYTGVQGAKDNKISVLEYQGLVPVRMLKEAGVEVPEDVDDEDSIESIVVLAADGIVIKACVNPLGKRQFKLCPYKKRPGFIYGMGVAEAMRDSQKMINSAARLLIDNKALSGNGMVGINLDRINTKRTTNLEVYPGKVWYVKGNYSPHEAVSTVAFPDITMGLRELIEMFERFADEETGIPKYTQGTTDGFLNKTATGMSMLMSQANINIKTVLKNIDNYLIEPIVEDMDAWFAEFEDEVAIPIRIKATGVDSIIAKEIKMENYMRFMQVTASPQDAIFMNRVKLMKAIARLLETEDVMRADEEIKQLMTEMTNQATSQQDWKEFVDIDKIYPMLARSEQVQVLQMLGIQPEMNQIIQTAAPSHNGDSSSLSPTAADGQLAQAAPSELPAEIEGEL
jgi:hypothetical protein